MENEHVTAMEAMDYDEHLVRAWPVAVQPKCDGVRMLRQADGTCASRDGKPLAVPASVRAALAEYCPLIAVHAE